MTQVIPGYLTAFLNSDVGELILSTERAKENVFIPKLNRAKIENIEIAIPPIEVQKDISHRIAKVLLIINKVADIQKNISINPVSSDDDLEKLDSILEVVEGLTKQEGVQKLIRHGESKVIEFKETLSLDVKKQTKEKYIETGALKTVAGFLNSDGGDSLIGVRDDGNILGLEEEIKKLHKALDDKFYCT